MVPSRGRAAATGPPQTPAKRLSTVAHDVQAQDDGDLLVTAMWREDGVEGVDRSTFPLVNERDD